jgi:hypothetical protein
MIIIDNLLYGMLAGLITLKVLLLAVATVLLVHNLAKRPLQKRATPVPARRRRPRIDIYA